MIEKCIELSKEEVVLILGLMEEVDTNLGPMHLKEISLKERLEEFMNE